MGMFGDVFRSLFDAALATPVEELCRACGWHVDERHGNRIVLYFKGGRHTPLRKLNILNVKDGALAFFIMSGFMPSPRELPVAVPTRVLCHNTELSFCAWALGHDEDEDLLYFTLRYTAMAEGMTPAFFKFICEHMVSEVAEFDSTLASLGLLR